MAYFQYKDEYYEMADGTTNEQAISKIRTHLGEKTAAPDPKNLPTSKAKDESFMESVGSNVVSGIDMMAGIPKMLLDEVKWSSRAAIGAIGGEKDPTGQADKYMEETADPEVDRYLSTPMRSLITDTKKAFQTPTFKQAKSGSTGEAGPSGVDAAMEHVGKQLERTEEYWNDKVGSGVGSAIKHTANLLMFKGDVAFKAAGIVTKPVYQAAKSGVSKAAGKVADKVFVKTEKPKAQTVEEAVKDHEYSQSKIKEGEEVGGEEGVLARKREQDRLDFIASTPEQVEHLAKTASLEVADKARRDYIAEVQEGREWKDFKDDPMYDVYQKRADELHRKTATEQKEVLHTALKEQRQVLAKARGIDLPPEVKPVPKQEPVKTPVEEVKPTEVIPEQPKPVTEAPSPIVEPSVAKTPKEVIYEKWKATLNDPKKKVENAQYAAELKKIAADEKVAKTVEEAGGTPKPTEPKITEGKILEEDGTPAVQADGQPRIARRNKDTGEIFIDHEAAKASWEASTPENKPWIKEKFATPEEYAKFLIEHEKQHDSIKQLKGESDLAYEGRVNAAALEVVKPSTAPVSKPVVEKVVATNSLLPKGEASALVDQLLKADEAFTKEKPLDKSAIELVAQYGNEVRLVDYIASSFAKSLRDSIPEPLRHAITRAMDTGKTLYTDAEKAAAIKKTEGAIAKYESNLRSEDPFHVDYRDVYAERIQSNKYRLEELRKRPSEEAYIPMVEKIKARFAEIGKKAVDMGLIDGLLDNYVTHVLDFSKTKMSLAEQTAWLDAKFGGSKGNKLKQDFTEGRQYETLRELEKAVQGTGIVVHTDIAKVLEAYEKSMGKAMLDKELIDTMSAKTNADGNPWIIKSSDPLANGKDYLKFTGQGSKALEGYQVHKSVADQMGFYFREKDPSAAFTKISAINDLTKSINVVGSTFHAYNLGVAGITAAPIKNTAAIGRVAYAAGKSVVQAVPALVKPGVKFTEALSEKFAANVLTEKAGINDALRRFREGNDAVIELGIKYGAMFEFPKDDVHKTIIAELGIAADNLASKVTQLGGYDIKLVQHGTNALDRVALQRINHYTWDYMHTGLKVHTFITKFEQMRLDHPNMPVEQIAKEVATHVNDSFGGLNWAQIAADTKGTVLQNIAIKTFNKKGLDWARIAMFAPDWTLSTARAMTKALPKELLKPKNWELLEGAKGIVDPKTSGDLSRRYVLATVVGYATLQNAINYAFSGHSIFENENKARIDLGDGTEMQLAKHSMEGLEWILHPAHTAGNKVGFWPKTAVEVAKLKDSPASDVAKEVAKQALPFSVGSYANAPKGSEWSRAIGSTLGVPIYKHPKRDMMDLDDRAEYDAARLEDKEIRKRAISALKKEYTWQQQKEWKKRERSQKIADKIDELRGD